MKIAHQWLEKYLDIHQEPEKVAELLTQMGLEVSHVTTYKPFPDAIVVGKVEECGPHPNADKLKVASVKLGEKEFKKIVCGAPNLAVGQKVAVAPIGTVLPLPKDETLTIKPRKIRGVLSEGMICSAPELGFQGDASGIWVLNTKAAIGTPLSKALGIGTDTIYTIDLTPNRNDACGHLGVARDLAASLNKELKTIHNFTMIPQSTQSLHATIRDTKGCSVYTGLIIDDITLGPSPAWLQSRLRSIGITPTDNVTDIMRYITHDLGHPISAFPCKQTAHKKIIIQKLPKGTLVTMSNGKTLTLNGQEVMICDGAEKPLAMGGIMACQSAAITPQDKSIIIESAYFDPVTIAKTARYHGLHTDASYRFERGADPHIPYLALQRTAQMMLAIAGGKIVSCPINEYSTKIVPRTIKLTYDYIYRIIGAPLPEEAIDQILHRLDITYEKDSRGELTLTIPPYRRDVTRPIDVVEDILRIYGYNHPKLKKEASKSYPFPQKRTPEQNLKGHLRTLLPANGFHEIRNNPFIATKDYADIAEINPRENVLLTNPLHEAYAALPQSLLFAGLRTLQHNIARQEPNIKYFEIAKTYSYKRKKIGEQEHLALWMTGQSGMPSWRRHHTPKPFTLHDLQAALFTLCQSLGFPTPRLTATTHTAYRTVTHLQILDRPPFLCGEIAPKVAARFDLKQPVFFAELPLNLLLAPPPITYTPLSKYPHLSRDISLALPKKVSYATMATMLAKAKIPLLKDYYIIDCYEGEALPDQKSYTLRLVLQDAHSTLQEKKVAKIIATVSQLLVDKLGATIRL